MKETMKKVNSFITFDLPLQIDYISLQFASTQLKLQTEIPGWSTTATRQKLISKYWFTYVVGHFASVLGLPALIVFLFGNNYKQPNVYLLSVVIAGLLSFCILYLFNYRPIFSSIFLPHLETVKEAYERKELKQLEKCRKAQLPNPTLILIHHVIDIASGMNTMQSSDKFAGLLMKLYGVDPRSLKSNMDLLLGSSIKRKDLKGRERTEISNRFAEAHEFFEELSFLKGIKILNDLEVKFFDHPNEKLKK